MNARARLAVLAGAAGLASACSFAPRYSRPATPAPPAVYQEADGWKTAQPADEARRGAWWEIYHDESLSALENQVTVSNQNLKAAFARLEQARAQTGIERSYLFPAVSAAARANRTRQSVNSPTYNDTKPLIENDFAVNVDVSYEFDVWGRIRNLIAAALTALAIALVTPPLWTTWRPRWLPWFLESYINGVHIFDKPQPWLFPLFPWAGFAFAGLAIGFVLVMPAARQHELRTVALIATAGAAIYAIAHWADAQPRQLYAEYDFWHSSPNFFLMRIAILLGIMLLAYAWCRWGLPSRVFSPLVQLGQTSLLVYWVHIDFVYGGLSILAKRSQTIPRATLGLAIIFTAMLILSILRTRFKGRGKEILARLRSGSRDLTEAGKVFE